MMSVLVGFSERSCGPKLNLDVSGHFLLLPTGKNRWNIWHWLKLTWNVENQNYH